MGKKGSTKKGSTTKEDEVEDVSTDESWKKYVAEFIGTFALVFFGCGAAVFAGAEIGWLGISFAFGITVLFMVYAIGPISGCHINPAITIAMLVAKKIESKDAVFYIVVQFIGATAAAGLLLAIGANTDWYTMTENGLGQNGFGNNYLGGYGIAAAIIAEVVLTFFFLIVIFGSTHKKAPAGFAGIAIGLSLFVIHLIGIPITGTSVNPARSFGPAVLMAIKETEPMIELPVFLFAPVVGAILAAFVWMHLLQPRFEGEPDE
jgi:aquaporin Z